MEADDAVMVSDALLDITDTGTNVFAAAYVPLAGMEADISQLPVPTMET